MSLDLLVQLTARLSNRLFHLVFESHDGKAGVPIPKRSRSHERHDTVEVDGLKVLDPKRPIREADIGCAGFMGTRPNCSHLFLEPAGMLAPRGFYDAAPPILNCGNLAILEAIRRASSFVSKFTDVRRPGSSS